MHAPTNGARLPLPVHLKPYIVGRLWATREELRAALGQPHYVETDSTRTLGGDEDDWAWELPSGLRLLLVLQVPYGQAMLCSDPPDLAAVVAALGIDAEKQHLELLPTPVVHPDYTGP